jgi:hypothetical protein
MAQPGNLTLSSQRLWCNNDLDDGQGVAAFCASKPLRSGNLTYLTGRGSKSMEEKTWQHVGNGTWYFGAPVRGIIRNPLAIVHRTNDSLWVYWEIMQDNRRGSTESLSTSIEQVEKMLGV